MQRLLRIAAYTAALATIAMPARAQEMIDLNVRSADLRDVINLIAMQAHVNIVVDDSVKPESVSLRLHDVGLEDALGSLESAYGLAQARVGNVIHIGTLGSIVAQFPASNDLRSATLHVTYGHASEMARGMAGAVPSGSLIVPDDRSNTIYVKGTRATVAAAREYLSSMNIPVDASTSRSVRIALNNIKPVDALTIMRQSIAPVPPNMMAASDFPTSIILTGDQDFIDRATVFLKTIDIETPEVMFTVRVADITPNNDSQNIGFEYGGVDGAGTISAASGSTFTAFANKVVPINATLNFLVSHNEARVLASPQILARNNTKATLNVGSQFPIVYFNPASGQNQVQFINAGVDLTITPTIGANGTLLCDLDTDYSQFTSFSNGYPVIGTRHVTNQFQVGNDDAIVLAGLFQDVTSTTIQKVPFLGDIPILGEVFKNRLTSHTRDEVVFVITPHVITPADIHPASDADSLLNSKTSL